ncbi:MAG: DUF87 domain-containing protein, partial [Candidatus Lokiarchaeota archaeon]|nr:DUF87 domain-containing protein [Candidatus Lokiarchaeota archaeon]
MFMENKIKIRKVKKIAHLIFISNPKEISFKKMGCCEILEGAEKAFELATDLKQDSIRDLVPEIDALFRFLEEQKLQESECQKIELKICIVFEKNGKDSQLRAIEKLLEKVIVSNGMEFFRLDLDKKESDVNQDLNNLNSLKHKIIEIQAESDELFLNLTTQKPSLKKFIINIANEIGADLYQLNNFNDLVIIPGQNIGDNKFYTEERELLFNFNDLIIDSLKFNELNRTREPVYEISINNYLENQYVFDKIIDGVIVIKNIGAPSQIYEAVKLFSIEGVGVYGNKKVKIQDLYIREVIEGLSFFNCQILRMIINDGKGVEFYFATLACDSSKNSAVRKAIHDSELFIRLLKTTFPYVRISELNNEKIDKILDFLSKQNYYSAMAGFPTGMKEESILEKLENSISGEKWGLITIGHSLTDEKTEKILKNLKSEFIFNLMDRLSQPEQPKEFEVRDGKKSLTQIKRFEDNIKSDNYANLVDKIYNYLEKNKTYGLWNTSNYILSSEERTYKVIYSIVKSWYKNLNSFWFPFNIHKLDSYLMQFPKLLQPITVERKLLSISDELKLFNTVYTSKGLSNFAHLPLSSLKNFQIEQLPEFQEEFPEEIVKKMNTPVKIGNIKNIMNSDEGYYIDLDSLNRHCLVMGATGAGKTNTIMNLLSKVRKHSDKLPFLIIEPVKKEFRHIANYIDNLKIYT